MTTRVKAEQISGQRKRPRKEPRMENPGEVYEIIDLETNNDLSFYSRKGTTLSDPISVEQYIDDRDLHLAIMASLASHNNNSNFIDLENPQHKNPILETGQSSKPENDNDNDTSFVCEICAEPKSAKESFPIKGCGHSYCTDCVPKYVASKLHDNITTITCPVPDCGGSLEPEHCRSILPTEVFDRWGFALCEALILGLETSIYCPYKDCSVMLIDDGVVVVRESECPSCCRLFCAQCKVPWHTGIGCEEFQKLNKDEREKEDIMLMNLAKQKQWRRCPKCRFYVERTEGCLFMKCRCRTAFCYNCGGIIEKTNIHYCSKCRR